LVENLIESFNSGRVDWQTACERLQISRAHLYRLRTKWLRNRALALHLSGGNHKDLWPEEVQSFLRQIILISKPLNYAFLSDQVERRFGFKRSRAALSQFVELHFPALLTRPCPGPQPRRRWQCACIGELWQHDSSPHQWWPASQLQNLILTADDHSRKILAAVFDEDTTWSHFCHIRSAFESHGRPTSFYTDGLSLFGHTSAADRLDTCSQFQRALSALQINHRVAPSPQAKGKIERLFGTFQKRLVTLFAYEKISNHHQANELLQTEIAHHNASHRHSTTGLTAQQAWSKALEENRSKLQPMPAKSLLDLHLALHIPRRVSSASTVEFLGRTWKITPTKLQNVLLIHHPQKHFWIIKPTNP